MQCTAAELLPVRVQVDFAVLRKMGPSELEDRLHSAVAKKNLGEVAYIAKNSKDLGVDLDALDADGGSALFRVRARRAAPAQALRACLPAGASCVRWRSASRAGQGGHSPFKPPRSAAPPMS